MRQRNFAKCLIERFLKRGTPKTIVLLKDFGIPIFGTPSICSSPCRTLQGRLSAMQRNDMERPAAGRNGRFAFLLEVGQQLSQHKVFGLCGIATGWRWSIYDLIAPQFHSDPFFRNIVFEARWRATMTRRTGATAWDSTCRVWWQRQSTATPGKAAFLSRVFFFL